MLNDIQNMVLVFANLAVASATAMCFVIGIAGTFNQRLPYDCYACRPAAVEVAKLTPATPRPIALASIVR